MPRTFLLPALLNGLKHLSTMNSINEFKPNKIVGFRPNEVAARLMAKAKKANPHRDWTHMVNEAVVAHFMPQFGGKTEAAMLGQTGGRQ